MRQTPGSTSPSALYCSACVSASGAAQARRLVVPAQGRIPVAFVVSDGAVMIDFAGPWEVFEDVMVPSRGARMEDQHIFQPYTVSNTRAPFARRVA